MKHILSLFFSICCFTIAFSQAPGGVPQPDMWGKVIKNPTATTFQYKDFSMKNRPITGTVIPSTFFNFNQSYTYTTNFVSFLSKIESLKDATIFIVNLPTPPPTTSPITLQALMNADLTTPVTGTQIVNNEHAFQFNTTNFVNNNITASGAMPSGAKINTVVWHNFNARNMVRSYGTNGESTVFVGRSIGSVVNFVGQIPEFIIYRRALNDKEKLRVESYLALKYGITLDSGFDYVNSKYEPFWHQTNNALFSNRIFGIGRDGNSSLYQKQSASSHLPDKLVYWSATNAAPAALPANNLLNTTTFDNQNFITIGDNGLGETPNTLLLNGITKIGRVWLAEKFGGSIHDRTTSLRYQTTGIALAPTEALWMLIDRNATNALTSTFTDPGVEVIPITTIAPGGFATFPNIRLATDTDTYSQFTFGVGPRMIVTATPRFIACENQVGDVDFSIKGGLPIFTVHIHGTKLDNPSIVVHDSQLTQSNRDFFLNLPLGNYTISVTDATGFSYAPPMLGTSFTVNPKPGMQLELGPNQVLVNPITLNAAANMDPSVAANITYSWDYTPTVGIALSGFDTNPSIIIPSSGLGAGVYTCTATNTITGCILTDTITILTPIMTITATPVPLACAALNGTVNFVVSDGYPNYVVNIVGTNSGNTFNNSITQTTASFSIVLPLGSYTATITDSTTYSQTASFDINPTPGMILELGPPQSILSGNSVNLNAGANITAPSVTYFWTYVGSGTPPLPTTPTITITDAGTYTCTVLNTATNCTVSDSFVLTVIPNMTFTATPVHNSCSDGIADFVIQDGLPPYTVNIHGTDTGNNYNDQFIQSNLTFSSVPLYTGSYLATVTDASGFVQTASFVINPLAGMALNLGPNQVLTASSSITIDASTNITATNVSYEWNYNGSSTTATNPFSSTAIAVINEPGTYTCTVTNTTINCTVSDSIEILPPPPPIANNSQVYPNPSTSKFRVKVTLDAVKDVDISICDVSGKSLIKDYLNGFNQYETNYELKTTGVYFIKIVAKDYTTTHKLIIN